jgi:hypothetical protein
MTPTKSPLIVRDRRARLVPEIVLRSEGKESTIRIRLKKV